MRKKAIPPPTLHNVLPPNLDRDYFDEAATNPFRPQAQAFEPVNAWWLAEAALLAYADEGFARRQFGRAGLGEVALVSKAGSQCYLAESRDVVIAAFRGTQVPKPGVTTDAVRGLEETVRDFLADVDFRLVETEPGRFVHAGFKGALDSIWSDVEPRLLGHARARRPIWMTGHSLGAALATLAADRLRGVQGLYVFGSPAVGDRTFADAFPIRTFRIVHHRDIVARVPPFGSRSDKVQADYVHVGVLKYIDGEGRMRDEADGTESLRGLTRDAIRSLFRLPSPGRLAGLLGLARGPFDDHAPLYYALRSWNCYVDLSAGPPVTQ
jgi:triacylglycerol lipase